MRNYKEQTEKILELVEQKKKVQEKRKNILVTISSLAACAVIALLCTSLFSGGSQKVTLPVDNNSSIPQTTSISAEINHKTKASKSSKTSNPKTTKAPKTTSVKVKTSRTKTQEIIITPTKPIKTNKPDIDEYLSHNGLNENGNDVILYNGKSYVKTCTLEATGSSKETLLNQYLGKVTGKIDSKATDEITSNVGGKVYTINGYSEEFRLGILRKDKSTGNSYIYIFDNLHSLKNSDISTGSALFNDILHIDNNLSFINYYCGTNLKIAYLNQNSLLSKISAKSQKSLLDTLNNASLINGDEYTFDNNYKKVALFLNMTDETTVEIYLTKGGYIYCDGLYFKTDDDIFTEIYNSLTEEEH